MARVGTKFVFPVVPDADDHENGLDFVSEAIVKQPIRGKEVFIENFFNFELANKYKVYDIKGQKLFDIEEESGCLSRNLLGNKHCFQLNVINSKTNQLEYYAKRPFRMGCLCVGPRKSMFGKDYIIIYNKNHQKIGSIGKCWGGFCKIKIKLWNESDETLVMIKRNCCFRCFSCCQDVNFQFLDKHNKPIGDAKITKKWGGITKELFSDADTFKVQFPSYFKTDNKACLLIMSIMIDYLYFESPAHQDD